MTGLKMDGERVRKSKSMTVKKNDRQVSGRYQKNGDPDTELGLGVEKEEARLVLCAVVASSVAGVVQAGQMLSRLKQTPSSRQCYVRARPLSMRRLSWIWNGAAIEEDDMLRPLAS